MHNLSVKQIRDIDYSLQCFLFLDIEPSKRKSMIAETRKRFWATDKPVCLEDVKKIVREELDQHGLAPDRASEVRLPPIPAAPR